MFFIIMLLDGNFGTFTIKAAYLPIMEGILLTITVAFYGSRGAEKIVKTQGDTAKAKASIEAEAIKPNVQEILDEEPTPSVPETAK